MEHCSLLTSWYIAVEGPRPRSAVRNTHGIGCIGWACKRGAASAIFCYMTQAAGAVICLTPCIQTLVELQFLF